MPGIEEELHDTGGQRRGEPRVAGERLAGGGASVPEAELVAELSDGLHDRRHAAECPLRGLAAFGAVRDRLRVELQRLRRLLVEPEQVVLAAVGDVAVLQHELASRLKKLLAGGNGGSGVVADAGVDAAQVRSNDLGSREPRVVTEVERDRDRRRQRFREVALRVQGRAVMDERLHQRFRSQREFAVVVATELGDAFDVHAQ
jgi:hypothetical protein